MKKNSTIEMIKTLSNANGISGFEDEVLEIIRQELPDTVTVTEDSLRNLYVYMQNTKKGLPVVMLDAHTDEVGFMVKAVRPDGMLEFIMMGGWVAHNIPAHPVRVRNRDGIYIPGVIAAKPPHFMTEAEKKTPPDISQMVIDVGASSAEEIKNDYRIDIAAPVVPAVECTYDEKHGILTGKAFDDRLGCAAALFTLKEVYKKALKVNAVWAFSAQEEVGTRGAAVTANRIKPDIAIVFEGCPADDTVVPAYQAQTVLKKGPMLRHIDSRMITNPRFQKYALEIAHKFNIPVQTAVRSAGSTDGAPIHLSNMGVPVIVIGIPVRYAHSHHGISAYSDLDNSVKLATAILTNITKDIITGF